MIINHTERALQDALDHAERRKEQIARWPQPSGDSLDVATDLITLAAEVLRLREESKRLDWLEADVDRLEDVRSHYNNEGDTIRGAIDKLSAMYSLLNL